MFPLRRAAFELVETLCPEDEERLFLVITGLDPLVPAVFDIPVTVFDVHFGDVFITRLCAPVTSFSSFDLSSSQPHISDSEPPRVQSLSFAAVSSR